MVRCMRSYIQNNENSLLYGPPGRPAGCLPVPIHIVSTIKALVLLTVIVFLQTRPSFVLSLPLLSLLYYPHYYYRYHYYPYYYRYHYYYYYPSKQDYHYYYRYHYCPYILYIIICLSLYIFVLIVYIYTINIYLYYHP